MKNKNVLNKLAAACIELALLSYLTYMVKANIATILRTTITKKGSQDA